MLRRLASLALLITLCGAAPRAVIEGPSTRAVGQSILLDGRKSISDRQLRWKLLGPVAPLLTFDADGRQAVYAFIPDPEPGDYVVALVAVGATGEEIDADVFLHRVVVGPIPPGPRPPDPTPPIPPDPTPPVPPDPSGLGLHAHILSATRSIPPDERVRGAGPLADAYRETVRLARDGKFVTAQAVIDDVKPRVTAARLPSWSSFSLAPKLAELAKAGKIVSVIDVTKAFQEIANALQEVADGR